MVEAAAADWRNRRRECDGIAFVMGYEDETGQRGVSRRIEDRKAPLHAGTPFEHSSLAPTAGSQAAAFVSQAQNPSHASDQWGVDGLAGWEESVLAGSARGALRPGTYVTATGACRVKSSRVSEGILTC
jgi:hypothetical protein